MCMESMVLQLMSQNFVYETIYHDYRNMGLQKKKQKKIVYQSESKIMMMNWAWWVKEL